MSWLVLGFGYALVYVIAEQWLFEGMLLATWFRAVAFITPPVLAVMAIVRRRNDWEGCHRVFWATVAIGLAVSTIGFLGWTLDGFFLGRDPSPLEWHAVLALFGTAAPLLALLAQPHLGSRERAAATTAVDIAGIAVFTGFLFSYVIMALAVARTAGSAQQSFVLLSEFLLAIVLAALAAAAFVTSGSAWRLTYQRLALGMLVQFIARSLTNARLWMGGYDEVAFYDVTFIVPFFFFLWALEAAPSSDAQPLGEEPEPSRVRPWLIFGALSAIPLLDYGLRAVFPIEEMLGRFRGLSTSANMVAALPLLMARLAVERSELRTASDELRLMAATLEQADDQIGVFTTDGQLWHVNAAYRRASGYSAEELPALQQEQLLGDDSHPQIPEMQATLRAGRVWRGTLTRRRKDGGTFVSSSTIVPLVDECRRQTHFASFERDVTEDTRLRDQLVQSEQRYRSLFDNAQHGIYRATPQGRFLAVNPTLVRMLGYDSPGELMAVGVATLYKEPTRRAKLVEQWRLQREIPSTEVAWLRRDGTDISLQVSGSIIADEQTGDDTFEIFAEDITARQQLEAELRQAQKMEAVGQLAGGVAHDFNNQLTAILGYTELLLAQHGDDSSFGQDLHEIQRAARSSAKLTQQLLAFSRKQVLKLEMLDLNQVVRRMGQILGRVVGEHITLKANLSDSLPCVRADSGQLDQVLMNLAVNARDAMPDGGVLTIETSSVELRADSRMPESVKVTPGRYVVLSVSDTGQGMDTQTRGRIFEPFFTTKAHGKGTGLGLATVYGIVKQLDGYIWVHSEPDQGASFTLHLPASSEMMKGMQAGGSTAERAERAETILLVEDEDAVRHFSSRVLRRHGYQVIEAATPQEALEIASDGRHLDLVLTDVVMPGLSGPDLLARLRERRAVRGLLMTGYTEKLITKGDSSTRVLEKPFESNQLLRSVRRVLKTAPVGAAAAESSAAPPSASSPR